MLVQRRLACEGQHLVVGEDDRNPPLVGGLGDHVDGGGLISTR